MLKEEIEAKQQNRRENNERASEAWTAYKSNTANPQQLKYVKSTGFGKTMLAWKNYKEDPLTVPLNLQLYLVKGIAWKTHKARILGMGDEGAELAAQIASIEASANAEMKRLKAEKERIEAEREKKRLDSIYKELESIKKIPVEKRTTMQTIRCNFLNAILNGTRREQVYWREKHTAEKKTLKAEKAAERRVEIDSQIKSLSTTNRTDEEEFQFNVLKAELRGDKNEVKRLKIEKKLKSIPSPNNRTELQQIDFDLLNAQLRGDKKEEVKRLKIEKKAAEKKAKEEKRQLRIEKKAAEKKAKEKKRPEEERKAAAETKRLDEERKASAEVAAEKFLLDYRSQKSSLLNPLPQTLQQQNVHTQLSFVVFPWLSQAEQQRQQQLVQLQILLSQEEQMILQQQYSTIGKRQQERLLQIQQQKQQNLVAYMQLQTKSQRQQQQHLQQLQQQQYPNTKHKTLEELRASRSRATESTNNQSRRKFTKDEDLRLWKAFQEKGRKWTLISTEYFKGKHSGGTIMERIKTAEFKNRIDVTFGPGTYDSSA